MGSENDMANIVSDFVRDITEKFGLPDPERVLPFPGEVARDLGLPTPKALVEDVVSRVKGMKFPSPPWR